jgi:uncharacterized RDD family membrane protein YckC
MVKDSVREELQTKIGVSSRLKKPATINEFAAPPKVELAPAPSKPEPTVRIHKNVPPAARPAEPKIELAPPPKATPTVELNASKTSPTLVGFQAKNPTVPDWRLELQNAVRQRKAGDSVDAIGGSYQKQLVTSGANALKPEYVEVPKQELRPEHKDPRVAAALKRIEESRVTFLSETPAPRSEPRPAQPNKNFPFNVVQPDANPIARPPAKASVNVPPKPRLVSSTSAKGYDTNKLPKLSEAEVISSFDMPVPIPDVLLETRKTVQPEVFLEAEPEVEESYIEEVDSEQIEDLAPFSIRFNAGVFDLIIGAFASLILLSPLAFTGGEWLSTAGFLTFLATCSIVMFLYMTVSIGIFGKTVGMKMFALELIDADENEYPTFHQAAVSAATYLLSLPLLGIGFVTVFFNDEKRAAHDLLSGTIIVMEF